MEQTCNIEDVARHCGLCMIVLAGCMHTGDKTRPLVLTGFPRIPVLRQAEDIEQMKIYGALDVT
jgi:hypothetical protein